MTTRVTRLKKVKMAKEMTIICGRKEVRLQFTKTDRFGKKQPYYSKELVDVVRRIPSAPKYDADAQTWSYPIDFVYPQGRTAMWYALALGNWAKRTKDSRGHLLLTGYHTREADLEEFADDVDRMLPFEGEHYMLLNPYPYQLLGVRYALDHKRCIFGDQPGLGKTLQAICTVVKGHKEAQRYGDTFPVLVICPAALKINWQREFKKFAGMDSIILDDRNKSTWHLFHEKNMCHVFITNYESLKKFFVVKIDDSARFTQRSIQYDPRKEIFKAVIIDESHKCKTNKTQQSKFVEGICKGKRWVFELTGTPVVNNNADLIQQLKIMGRLNDFGGYRKFVDRYCDGVYQSSNIKELNHRLWQTCFFRREKQKVLTELPDKTRQYMQCDISNTKEYQDAEKDLVNYLREYKSTSEEDIQRKMKASIMVKMGILKQISARGKIKAVAEFVHDIIDGGEKLILFAYLKEVVSALKKEFPKAVTVTGDDSIEQKQAAVDAFQTRKDVRLIILNYKSGGTGLTLTASSRVAFIEFPWTYSDCEQAEDRAHRNGQKNNVNCYYFLGNGTIDEYMYKIIQTKKSIADGVTGTTTNITEQVTQMALDFFGTRI